MAAEPPQRRRARRPSIHPALTQTHHPIQQSAAHHYGIHFYWKLASLLAVGLIFHLVYMLSIFDIYFRSPLVQGLDPVQPTAEAPAKRLVLFVGDGCRADSAFLPRPDGRPRMPFLNSICQTQGSFGVSHTRVPTESRPGHIAMIAGFYEDVSAVTKGWKANPVDYDHILARAKYAWSFGAPEIVDLFSGPRVIGAHYSAEMIDFATADAKQLDQWSFDRLRELFEAASVDEQLAAKLKSDQVVIFVHLLGLDTNGHAFKPHSKEYLENVEFVDRGIKQAVKMIEEFYEDDGKTAFIYTADHGMSDAGTHGDGDPDNTRTPLVVWGAGLSTPQATSLGLRCDHDAYSVGWGLGEFRRRDIQQADLTPLMASLVGIPVPVNSEGVLPVKLLGVVQEQRCRALLDNARQISTSYGAKEAMKSSREPWFRPAPVPCSQVKEHLTNIASLIENRDYADAQRLTFATIKESLAGLAYLHKYDSVLLKVICSAGYLGWMLHALIFIASHYNGPVKRMGTSGRRAVTFLFVVAHALLTLWLLAKRSPLQYHLYAAFASGFWHQAFSSFPLLSSLVAMPFTSARRLPAILAYLVGLELLVLTFFQRGVLAALNGVLALALAVRHFKAHPYITFAWIGVCAAMAWIPLNLEPIKHANDFLYTGGIAAIFVVSLLGFFVALPDRRLAFITRAALIPLSGWLARDSDRLLAAKAGLPPWNQNTAWLLLAFSLLAPIVARTRGRRPVSSAVRLLDLFMCLAPAYIMLSISYEPLFYALFALQLAAWISLESGSTSTASTSTSRIGLDHLWIAFAFLFFVNLAFFGTGNMASISSFTLSSVYRFMTVFAPFPMAALLILKLLIPFALLAAAFGVLARRSGAPPFSLVLLVIATTDVMTLNFFFMVRDHGSWLEIGSSISHFVIASSLIIFTVLLSGLASFLLSGVVCEPSGHAPDTRNQAPHVKID